MFVSMDQIYVKSSVELNITIIKTVFIMLCIFYTNYKINGRKIKLNFQLIKSNLILIILGIIFVIIKNEVNQLISIMSTIMIISIVYSKNKVTKAIISTVISYAINYTILYMTLAISFMFNIYTGLNNDYINLIVILISHFILLYLFFRIKRFQKGFSFLKGDNENEYMDILV